MRNGYDDRIWIYRWAMFMFSYILSKSSVGMTSIWMQMSVTVMSNINLLMGAVCCFFFLHLHTKHQHISILSEELSVYVNKILHEYDLLYLWQLTCKHRYSIHSYQCYSWDVRREINNCALFFNMHLFKIYIIRSRWHMTFLSFYSLILFRSSRDKILCFPYNLFLWPVIWYFNQRTVGQSVLLVGHKKQQSLWWLQRLIFNP